MEVPKKLKYRASIWPSNPIPRYIPREVENRDLSNTCTPISMEALFTIAKREKERKCPLMDEEINMIYTNNAILFRLQIDILRHATIWIEPWVHYSKWNKSDTEGQILYDSTYLRYLEQSDLYRQKEDGGCPELR